MLGELNPNKSIEKTCFPKLKNPPKKIEKMNNVPNKVRIESISPTTGRKKIQYADPSEFSSRKIEKNPDGSVRKISFAGVSDLTISEGQKVTMNNVSFSAYKSAQEFYNSTGLFPSTRSQGSSMDSSHSSSSSSSSESECSDVDSDSSEDESPDQEITKKFNNVKLEEEKPQSTTDTKATTADLDRELDNILSKVRTSNISVSLFGGCSISPGANIITGNTYVGMMEPTNPAKQLILHVKDKAGDLELKRYCISQSPTRCIYSVFIVKSKGGMNPYVGAEYMSNEVFKHHLKRMGAGKLEVISEKEH